MSETTQRGARVCRSEEAKFRDYGANIATTTQEN